MTDWEARYRQGEHVHDAPHPLVTQFASKVKPGRALDLACGPGRHAVWLADHGWYVTAVDSSATAIQMLESRAREKHLRVNAVVADLEAREFVIQPESYDLIVNCNYLQRDLFPAIRSGTRIGGLVIAIIAIVDDAPDIKPMNPAYLLVPGELRAQFEGWEIVHDFEGKSVPGRRATAEIVAQRASPH